ncbi:MAG: hypothetical protein U0Q03_04855 [Acidimicrobiales bacterium]
MSTTGSSLDDSELEERLRETLAAVMPLLDALPHPVTEPFTVAVADPPSPIVDTGPSTDRRSRRNAVIGAAAALLLVLGGLVARLASDPEPSSTGAQTETDTVTSSPPTDPRQTPDTASAGQEVMSRILDELPAGEWIAVAVQPRAANSTLRLSVFDDAGRKLAFDPVPAGESLGAVQPTLAPIPEGSSGRNAYPYPDGTLLLVGQDGIGVHVTCRHWNEPCADSTFSADDLAAAADGLFDLVTSDLAALARNTGELIDPDIAVELASNALGTAVDRPFQDTGVLSPTGNSTHVTAGSDEIAVSQIRDNGLLIRWRLTAPITTSGLTEAEITQALDTAVTQSPTIAPAPSTTTVDNVTGPISEPLRLLPIEMPDGFPDQAASYRTTDLEGSQAAPTETKLYVGTGDTPPVVMVIISPNGSDTVDGFQDFTTNDAWPSYRIDVTRPDGRHDFIATGGLSADQARAVADALGVVNVDESPSVDLPFELAEVPFEHRPELAYAVEWTNDTAATITMLVESDHGVDALANGITWPINAITTDSGTVYISRDPTDPQFLQAGVVIEGHAINFEAYNVDADELIRMVASVTRVSDQEWSRRI